MRVALTGADGFTGRYLEQALAVAGVESVALTADLTDPAAVNREVAAARFDRLIHLAGAAFVSSDEWGVFYAVNQFGSFTLLDAVARHHPGARCILASSAQVYGPGAEGLVAEDRPADPFNHYAVSKYAMELGARFWADRLEIVVTRPFNYTGIGQEDRYLIPKIVKHFRARAARIELGNIHVRRDFGDVRSVADAYCRLALAEAVAASPLNIATGTLWSVEEVLARLEAITGRGIEVAINPAFVRTDDVPMLGGDPSRLKAAIPGWAPRPLEETLRWMLEIDV